MYIRSRHPPHILGKVKDRSTYGCVRLFNCFWIWALKCGVGNEGSRLRCVTLAELSMYWFSADDAGDTGVRHF